MTRSFYCSLDSKDQSVNLSQSLKDTCLLRTVFKNVLAFSASLCWKRRKAWHILNVHKARSQSSLIDAEIMSMSMSTSEAWSDSMLEKPMFVALGKQDGNGWKGGEGWVRGGWLGGMTIREGRHSGGDEERGMRG